MRKENSEMFAGIVVKWFASLARNVQAAKHSFVERHAGLIATTEVLLQFAIVGGIIYAAYRIML